MSHFPEYFKKQLQHLCPGRVEFDLPLSSVTHWQIGGRAAAIARPNNKLELGRLFEWTNRNRIPTVIIGSTSNLLFSDDGVEALLIQLGSDFSRQYVTEDGLIVAESGAWVPNLARFALNNGYTGLEHICGIPGTIGGLIYMNGGSGRRGIGDSVEYVQTIGRNGQVKHYSREQCNFGYRTSTFQERDEIIVEVGLRLQSLQSKAAVRRAMLEILKSRRKKFPRKLPNCGSVFVSDPAMYVEYGPPGKVIEETGLKGLRRNGAQVSDMHANFIVNNGDARASDVLHLIGHVKDKVYKHTGYSMRVEVRYVDIDGSIKELL